MILLISSVMFPLLPHHGISLPLHHIFSLPLPLPPPPPLPPLAPAPAPPPRPPPAPAPSPPPRPLPQFYPYYTLSVPLLYTSWIPPVLLLYPSYALSVPLWGGSGGGIA